MVDYFEEHWLELWLYTGLLSAFDETTITGGWLPGAGWTNMTNQVRGDITLDLTEQTRGWKASWRVNNESRATWDEGRPFAIVHKHWYASSGYGARALFMWGYLPGEGAQTMDRYGVQTGTRAGSYADKWTRTPTPSLQFGRLNLMTGAQFDAAKSVAPLATPSAEVQFREYVSQAVVDGTMGNDQNADTAVVSTLVAALALPSTLGNTVQNISNGVGFRPVPRIRRLFIGRTSHVVGAGGQTAFVEITCHAMHINWDFETPAAIPAFNEVAAGSPYPATISNSFVGTAFVAGAGVGGSQSFRVRLKNQASSAHPENGPYIQWNTGSGWVRLPAKLTFSIRAASTNPVNADYSVGRTVHVTLKQASPAENAKDEIDIVLTDQYVDYSLTLDSVGTYGGVMMRFGAKVNGVNGADMLWELDNLRVTFGFNDLEHAKVADSSRFTIAFDDGIGGERRVNLFNDSLLPDEWIIKPEETMIIADDGQVFAARFTAGEKTVVSLRARTLTQPNLWFGPLSAARLKTEFTTNPSRVDYDDVTNVHDQVEEVIFSGLNWTIGANPQAIVRDAPVSTGGFTTEDYPRLGLLTSSAFGSSYWTYNLQAYVAPTLAFDIGTTDPSLVVSDGDHYENNVIVQVDNELIQCGLNLQGALRVTTRGYNPAGAPFAIGHPNGPAAHLAGAQVIPWRNNVAQIGKLVSDVEIRRRAGLSRILDGKVLYSNEIAPPSPFPDFERTAGGYWKVYGFYSNAAGDVVKVPSPGGVPYVEARWLVNIVAHMEPYGGVLQRGKFNEIVARQYSPAASASGAYQSRQVAYLADMVGYLLVVHGGVPDFKYFWPFSGVSVDAVSVAPSMLSQVIDNVCQNSDFRVMVDGYGVCTLVPRPSSPWFRPSVPTATWGLADLRDVGTLTWVNRNRVAQVKLVARDVAGMRVHAVRYPDIAGTVGEIREIKDILVSGIDQARDFARAAYRQANGRRTPPVVTGYVPDIKLYDRHVINLPGLDPGGGSIGVNTYVTGVRIVWSEVASGSHRWRTTISLQELTL